MSNRPRTWSRPATQNRVSKTGEKLVIWDQQDDPVGQGTVCHIDYMCLSPETHIGMREPTLTNYPLTSTHILWHNVCIHTHKIGKLMS